jgi:sigma-E factor negative regulatory protein RseA
MSKMQDLNESLSCFMDGELHDHAAILSKLKNCNETKSSWLRYHLIRDTLRDSRSVNLSTDFSSRVMRALESEPIIISPRFSRYRSGFRKHMFKPAAGLAIAASVAAITVFTMQTFYMPDSQPGFNVASNAVPLQPIPAAASPDDTRLPAVVAAERHDDDLNSYLLEHMEHSAAGVQGMMPYVRLTGFEDSQ